MDLSVESVSNEIPSIDMMPLKGCTQTDAAAAFLTYYTITDCRPASELISTLSTDLLSRSFRPPLQGLLRLAIARYKGCLSVSLKLRNTTRRPRPANIAFDSAYETLL